MSTGVYTAYKKNGDEYYRVSITHKSRHISLGSYNTYETANNVYKEAVSILRDPDSLHKVNVYDYSTTYANCCSDISFEKFIILLNLRDNCIYIKTPVYLCKKYFLYFLTENEVLKFDTDDLFYYSDHKIMKRGSYYFVNDFGIQTSILNRFGIHNHSVIHRDYRFINNDIHDFRYSNICIINKYHGVEEILHNGRKLYKTKLHINGNFVIGTYPSENEAAVAYNKAADMLNEILPIKKNYQINYIENINSIEYASLYNNIRISKKFRDYIKNMPIN